VEEPLRLPVGPLPELLPKAIPADAVEAWRTALRLDLHRQGLLERILNDPARTPKGPRFRLLD
jgi:hypothetical protein